LVNETLDKAGAFLIHRVRDFTIRDWDLILDGTMRGETADEVRSVLANESECREVIRALIPMIVDDLLHQLLFAVEDNEDVRLSVESNGVLVDAASVSDGLAGELFSNRGWIARFSEYPASLPSNDREKPGSTTTGSEHT